MIFFWKRHFDECWKSFFPDPYLQSKIYEFMHWQEIEKQRYVWREKFGKLYKYSPKKAVFQASYEMFVKELANYEHNESLWPYKGRLRELVAKILTDQAHGVEDREFNQSAEEYIRQNTLWKNFPDF